MKKIYREELVSKGYITIHSTNDNTKSNDQEVSAFLNTLASYGFTMDLESINKLYSYSSISIKEAYFNMVDTLNSVLGNNVKHIVFYDNFPMVNKKTIKDYNYNAILHYLTAYKDSYGYMGQEKEKARMPLKNMDKLEILHLIDDNEGMDIIKEMVAKMIESKTAIPTSKRELIANVLSECIEDIHINEIPFKENMAFYIQQVVFTSITRKVKLGDVLSLISLDYISTVTDLLRVYAAVSNENFTLKGKIKFISLDRKARRVFVSIFDRIAKNNDHIYDELSTREFLWKRALEKLHIGEYKDVYPNAYITAKKFREDDYVTFNGEINRLYDEGRIYDLLIKLSNKPGVFARALDALLRKEGIDQELILGEFERVVTNISSPLLIQLYEFFNNRDLYNTRIFKVNKGASVFYKEVEDLRNHIDESIINEVLSIIRNGLEKIYASKDRIEKVYIDPKMKDYCIPVNNRSASSGYHTLPYASRIKLESKDEPILRFFSHWKNNKDKRIDLDLSAEFLDDNFNYVTSLSWHNMAGGKLFESYHSGDIVTAPNGASEFIDLNYKQAADYARYAIICNCVFTGDAFKDIPECFSGVMFRKNKGKTGRIFEASKVKYKFNLTQDTSYRNIAYVVDLKTMELIWIDCACTNSQSYSIAAMGNLSMIAIVKNALKKHLSIYDLVMLHKGHIEFVDNRDEAEFIIDDSSDSSLSPYDLEKLSADWL